MLNFVKKRNNKELKIKFVRTNLQPLKNLYKIVLLILLLGYSSIGFAQGNKRVSGSVVDSTKTGIGNANVMLIAGTDTLRSTTDADGYFSFSKIKSDSFSLSISSMAYQGYSHTYTFGKDKHLEIADIELKYAQNMLKTVEIKGKPNPIRFMQDTIEYNAAAFQVLEGDNVADLIKQFPGMEVDDEYNVKTQGKEMVKLRINGKDFFTNNIQDFIGKLPAGIVSKVQIIDDYGDEANFTGLKIGEPTKMLNIVTKPGMNRGKFGNARLNGGTNDQIGSRVNGNLWNDTKQSSGNLGYTTMNNGAGTSENIQISTNHRDKIGKNGHLGVNYNFMSNNNAFKSEQAIETLNPIGTFYTNSQNSGENSNKGHNLMSDFSFNNKKMFLNGMLTASYNGSTGNNSSINNQSGVIRQDLKNTNQSKNNSPNVNGNIGFSKILKNKSNSFSVNLGFSSSATNANQNISTNTLYYDKDTQILKKDSLLNRNLVTESNSQNVSLGFNFGLGLKKPKDSLARRSLNFSYNISIGNSRSDVSTFVFNNLNHMPRYVDSLSTKYTSLFTNQSLGINYNFSNKKIRYNFGLNARPSLMRNNYLNLNRKITNNTLNYAPNLNLSKTISKGKTVSISYTGNNNAPSINQMQPIRNSQNLQNVVIGNPNLKPYFNHRLSSNFNSVNAKSGISIMSGLSFATTRNEIVSNVILVPDTLNSLKQETRFENTNGTYNGNGNYSLNVPIKKNKYSFSYSGVFGISNRALFINNVKRFNKGFNFSQNLRGNVNLKKFTISGSTSYNFSSNTNILNSNSISELYYLNLGQISGTTFFNTHTFRAESSNSLRFKKLTLASSINYSLTKSDAQFNNNGIRNIQSIDMALTSRLTIKKSYFLGVNATKRINKGYSLANVDPFILNTSLTKAFLKNQALNLSVNANDLLNQGNNLSRYISGNSTIDSRTNQVTRVVTVALTYNLSQFGGRAFRVDADRFE
ncbi:MAG: TonB-dependent receptor [Chitinophagaceae bacterium]|nr:MAG: TonB-dependent receptor [Chitinophagaceae bacterium]